jgi:hypothetical protein
MSLLRSSSLAPFLPAGRAAHLVRPPASRTSALARRLHRVGSDRRLQAAGSARPIQAMSWSEPTKRCRRSTRRARRRPGRLAGQGSATYHGPPVLTLRRTQKGLRDGCGTSPGPGPSRACWTSLSTGPTGYAHGRGSAETIRLSALVVWRVGSKRTGGGSMPSEHDETERARSRPCGSTSPSSVSSGRTPRSRWGCGCPT